MRFSRRLPAGTAEYKGRVYPSPLVARWAAFFDLNRWSWHHLPPAVHGWQPTFRVEFPCGHSECGPAHALLVQVEPFDSIGQFKGQPGLRFPYGSDGPDTIPADASAAFGTSPAVTFWDMAHGAGGGEEAVANWVNGDADALWTRAAALIRAADDELPPGASGKCFNCGQPADALWQGAEAAVEVCGGCAKSTLPALIADAVHADHRNPIGSFDDALTEAAAAYWRAAACRLAWADRRPPIAADSLADLIPG